MSNTDNPAYSFDLAVHHECAHILANARDNRLFHCLRLRLDPERGWVGGVKPFEDGEAVPDDDDGDCCDDAPFGVVNPPVANQLGITETVKVSGVRAPKVVADALQARVPWTELAPLLFRYAAGQAGERLRAMQLDLGPLAIVAVMATEQTSMDRRVANLLSRRALNWSEAAFAEHWAGAVNEALQFLSQPSIWRLFLRLGAELMSKYDGSDEFWANWWGLSQDARHELTSLGFQAGG